MKNNLIKTSTQCPYNKALEGNLKSSSLRPTLFKSPQLKRYMFLKLILVTVLFNQSLFATSTDEIICSKLLSESDIVVTVLLLNDSKWVQEEVGVNNSYLESKVLNVHKGNTKVNTVIKPFMSIYSNNFSKEYHFISKGQKVILFLKNVNNSLKSHSGLFSVRQYNPIFKEYLNRSSN